MATATVGSNPVVTLTMSLSEAQLVRDLIGNVPSSEDAFTIYRALTEIPALKSASRSYVIQVQT